MDHRLRNQIDRILDEHADREMDVIVQMVPDKEIAELVRIGAAAIQSRQSLVTARDLIPPSQAELARQRKKSPARRVTLPGPLDRNPRTLPFTYPTRLSGRGLAEAHSSGQRALKPLLEWEKRNRRSFRGAATPARSQPFSASGSALLTVSRDMLDKLPHDVTGVSGIYLNQRVVVPPVARATREPAAVTENRGHTWGISRTGAMACWGAFDARGKGVTIAVLDTGIDPSHPNLKGKIAGFAEFNANGRMIRQGLKHARDSDEHGTHVAGSIVGSNSGGRWIGMAPDARILSALVLPKGGGTDAQILAGMQWALDSGADIISMSLGAVRMSADVIDTYTQMLITASLAGVLVTVAVGNDGAQITGAPGNDFYAFTVGATDVDDKAAGFSGGRTQIVTDSRYIDSRDLPLIYSKPDVTAPGVDIYSSVPGGGYASMSGTSMATPHVAGAAALLLSGLGRLRRMTGYERTSLVQQLLISSVKELGEAGQNHRFGYGRIDVLRALGFGLELGY